MRIDFIVFTFLSLHLFSIEAIADSPCSPGAVHVDIEGSNNTIENVGNRVCLENSILFIFSDEDQSPESKGYFDINQSIVWRADIRPKKVKYSNLFSYIDVLNKKDKSRTWRLPSFDELHEFRKVIKTKENENINKFSYLEVWAEPEDGEPSFYNLELGNRYSGKKFKKKRYLLLVSNDLN